MSRSLERRDLRVVQAAWVPGVIAALRWPECELWFDSGPAGASARP